MTITTTKRMNDAPARWSVDPETTSVEFSVKTFWGMKTVHGRFDRFIGSYEMGSEGAAVELTIDADSLDTGNATRDKHLRSADFFNVSEHAQVRFTSAYVQNVGSGVLHVVGRLEAAGRSVWLTFPAAVRPGRHGLEIEALTMVDRRELGLSGGMLGMIRWPVTLHVKATLIGGSKL